MRFPEAIIPPIIPPWMDDLFSSEFRLQAALWDFDARTLSG